MEYELKEGISASVEAIVTFNDTAVKLGSGNLAVYGTPAMAALMENAAKNCVDLYLPSGFSTVGIAINIKHIKSTAVGMKVRCEAVLTQIDRKKLFLKLEAWDEKGKIGEGTHVRYIVNEEEFLSKS